MINTQDDLAQMYAWWHWSEALNASSASSRTGFVTSSDHGLQGVPRGLHFLERRLFANALISCWMRSKEVDRALVFLYSSCMYKKYISLLCYGHKWWDGEELSVLWRSLFSLWLLLSFKCFSIGKEVQHLHFIIVPPQTNVKMVLKKLIISIHLVFTRY